MHVPVNEVLLWNGQHTQKEHINIILCFAEDVSTPIRVQNSLCASVPWSWLQTAWRASCTSSAPAWRPAPPRSSYCPEELRCFSDRQKGSRGLQQYYVTSHVWASVHKPDHKTGLSAVPCSVWPGERGHCAARAGNSSPRTLCSEKASPGVCCLLSTQTMRKFYTLNEHIQL